MSNYLIGHGAEKRAAKYLESQGYRIVDLNWKTRYCEIDIVAEKEGVKYFVEVKYRRSSKYGIGLEYVTQKKLKQMTFAAELWVAKYDWQGDYQLAAVSIDSGKFTFIELV